MATSNGWRFDADPNLVKLAVARCLIATMDIGRWRELGLLTGTASVIDHDPRLLRALHFGDDDYAARVYALLPKLLDEVDTPSASSDLTVNLPLLEEISDFLGIVEWLKANDLNLYSQVCDTADDGPSTAFADGMLLDATAAAATRMGVAEMVRQVTRLRRDVVDDPEAAVGHAKELIESTCKTILGLTGAGSDTREELPALVSRTLLHLGVHPTQVAHDVDPGEARAVKRLMGGVTSILAGAGELRNIRGTGHGRSGAPLVDAAAAHLAVGVASAAVLFLCELYESRFHFGAASLTAVVTITATGEVGPTPTTIAEDGMTVGTLVRHQTFGDGVVESIEETAQGRAARVRFDEAPGTKLLLLRYARLSPRV